MEGASGKGATGDALNSIPTLYEMYIDETCKLIITMTSNSMIQKPPHFHEGGMLMTEYCLI